MKDSLVPFFIHFLRNCHLGDSPILIAFSGGPDSRALLELFMDCKKNVSGQIHLAHVDHGWRSSSAIEAQQLKYLAEGYGLIWHQMTLSAEDFETGNKEERARVLRYDFFSKIYKDIKAQALFVGHQKEDLAETVLKRIFEGSGLCHLSGMRSDSQFEKMRVLRPLLSISKKQILSWLHTRGIIDYVVDHTNLSDQYLRGRMRQQMFPELEKMFGKNIVSSLVKISEESHLLHMGLQQQFERYQKKIIRGPACILLDRNQLQDLPDAQMVHFLSYVLKEEGLSVSWAVLYKIAAAFLLEKYAKEFLVEGVRICVEGAYLIVFQKPMPRFSLEHFQEGTYVQQDWHITTNSVGPEVSSMISGWKGAIKGSLIGFGVINGGRICYLDQMEDLQMKKKVLRRLSEKKVPVCLRSIFPFVVNNDGFVFDFLSFSNSNLLASFKSGIISISYCLKNK